MAVVTDSVARLFVAYLGRPVDAYGATLLQFRSGSLEPLEFRAIFNSPEYAALTSGLDLAGLIEATYQRLFNRGAEAAGQAYWQAEVSSGRLDRSLLPAALLQGAQGADAVSVSNKVAAARTFFDRLDTAPEKADFAGAASAAVARTFVQAVSSDPATLAAALAGADAAVAQATAVGVPGGAFFILTPGQDVIDSVTPSTTSTWLAGFGVSTRSADTFRANDNRVTVGQGDRIDGGGGTDLLSMLALNQVQDTRSDRITSVETARLEVGQNNTIDLSGVTDLRSVEVMPLAGGAFFAGVTTLRGISTAVALKSSLDAGKGLVVEFSDRALPAQLVTLDVAGSSGGDLSVAGIEALRLTTGSGISKTLGAVTAVDATSVNISGSGTLQMGALTLARGGTLTLDFDGFVGASGGIALGGDTHVVLNNAVRGSIGVNAGVATVVANTSGDIGFSMDRSGAGAGSAVSITANGTGAIQVIGSESLAAITAVGGARTDFFSGSRAADVFTGRGGADDFVLNSNDFIATSAAGLVALADTITDFGVSSGDGDRIRSVRLPGANDAPAAAGRAHIEASGVATFNAADATLVQKVTAVEAGITQGSAAALYSFAVFRHESDSYLFVSNNQAGVNSGDMLVKLAGVQLDATHFRLANEVFIAV